MTDLANRIRGLSDLVLGMGDHARANALLVEIESIAHAAESLERETVERCAKAADDRALEARLAADRHRALGHHSTATHLDMGHACAEQVAADIRALSPRPTGAPEPASAGGKEG